MKISACLITLNEESNLDRCLKSLHALVDEIVVVDSGSTDRTPAIAARYQARLFTQPWLGFVGQKNRALELAQYPWVLSIDADEELSPDLQAEILAVRNAPSTESSPTAGFSMPRCVQYEGRWIRHGDWYPDRLTRLFRKQNARFVGAKVHERLELPGPIHPFSSDLWHFSFADRADHWRRCEKYARLWAESQHETGRHATALAPWSHAAFRWFRGYILKRGFLDGPQGWHIAKVCAAEVHLKYSLLRELNTRSP